MDAARVELRKVVWPSRDDTFKTTIAVFVFVTAASLFFWLLDVVLAWATKFLTGTGS
jgi:preprotein translocase subunit SecE